jgi:CBS domain-containing protein
MLNSSLSEPFYLTEILGIQTLAGSVKIGTLSDFLIIDKDKVAEVSHICISRPFGRPTAYVPWDKVKTFAPDKLIIEIEDVNRYAEVPSQGAILLKDYILDKRVLDVEDREIEVVYDVRMALRNNVLYVIDVDISKYGLLRRIGLKWLAKLIYKLAEKIRTRAVAWSYVEPLPEQISSFKGDLKLKVLKEEFAEIPPVDLADILEEMGHEQRLAVFHGLDTAHASDTLEELDPRFQRDLIAALDKTKAAQLVNEMTPGQAADLLSALPWSETRSILDFIDKQKVKKIRNILEKQQETIVNYVVSNYMRFPPGMTVLQARTHFKQEAEGKEAILYLFVLGQDEKLLGVINLQDLLLADDEVLLKDIMIYQIVKLNPENTLKQAAEMFTRYHLRAIPVADQNDRMLGILPYRDVINLRHI